MYLFFKGTGICSSFFVCVDATSSERWGSEATREIGKYPAKIYTIDGMLIYQVENGSDNTDKSPLGGVISQSSSALSMLDATDNPITFYGNYAVINQTGHSGDLYDYYWTSYSRGTDGTFGNTNWHNAYLDGYIPLRVKSIYDPCPYLYRIPSNGTYNQFTAHPVWTVYSYQGGVSWNIQDRATWLAVVDERTSANFIASGRYSGYRIATGSSTTGAYSIEIGYDSRQYANAPLEKRRGLPVRCIEGFNVTFRTDPKRH